MEQLPEGTQVIVHGCPGPRLGEVAGTGTGGWWAGVGPGMNSHKVSYIGNGRNSFCALRRESSERTKTRKSTI